MLWLCAHLTHLPLEIFLRGERTTDPFVVIDAGHVVAANPPAIRGGVRAGMRLSAAQTLVPFLHHRERALGAEGRALRQIAAWALQFTSRISLQPPQSLMLEIGGSLRYFGGLETLRSRIGHGLETLGYRCLLAIAPTPTAALLLARAGREQPVTDEEELPSAISGLPVTVLNPDERQLAALDGLGVRTLGDCMALPRQGLSRRLGPGLMRQVDRALGRLAEPRRDWQPPARFHSELELSAEVLQTEHLIFGLNRLVRELCGYLRGTESGTQRFQIRLQHLRQADTPFSVGLVAAGRDPEHLLELTRQRLERITLPAPVVGLTLGTRDIHRLPPENRTLLEEQPAAVDGTRYGALLERLSARLGERTVQGVRIREEHRPEQAWEYAPPGERGPTVSLPERPTWLLTCPHPLEARGGQPIWHGPLVLERGPERIESGWWDGGDIARDYYIAVNPEGERVWLFRERRGRQGWFLHGIFA
ncbi:MAG: DNA polymerase Y family protein [Ectothiorhodospiraceae bacterium]|jgi:protein ImuB